MPYGYENTPLWKATIGKTDVPDEELEFYERLRTAYKQFRERAAELAEFIGAQVPWLTDHSVRHLDALWEVAGLLSGHEATAAVELNPIEAFVLGGSFLLHDLGNSIAAFENGVDGLKGPEWNDLLFQSFRKRKGRNPTAVELQTPDESAQKEAILQRLRQLHAVQAKVLISRGFHKQNDPLPVFLLDDRELRNQLGNLIGEISSSHHWAVSKVEAEFSGESFPAPTSFPSNWKVDRLKVAFLLRAADAVQIDSRRVPVLFFSIRRPGPGSFEHWDLQDHLTRAQVVANRVVFATTSPFGVESRESWWLGYDVLRMIHRELQEIDGVLHHKRSWRFTASGVRDIDGPAAVARQLRVDGWEPIDTSLRIGDVMGVIDKFGGSRLYGQDLQVPVRELIANAIDAVKARRAIECRASDWGTIIVRLGHEGERWWLEVEDCGIGMSKDTLTGPLVDFGTSYWSSQLVCREHPGLLSNGYQPIGKFGIGFFSVFMLGRKVRVTTRKLQPSNASFPGRTLVLQFDDGLQSRPLLRESDNSDAETLLDAGTRVRIWLRYKPNDDNGLFRLWDRRNEDLLAQLKSFVAHIAPAVDVDIRVEVVGDPRGSWLAVKASDWTTIELEGLIRRFDDRLNGHLRYFAGLRGESSPTRLFYSNGKPVARLWPPGDHAAGLLVVGGLAIGNSLAGLRGVVFGDGPNLARSSAEPLLNSDEYREWLKEIESWCAINYDQLDVTRSVATLFLQLGLLPTRIRCFQLGSAIASFEQLVERFRTERSVILLTDHDFNWMADNTRQLDISFEVFLNSQSDWSIDGNIIVAPQKIPGIGFADTHRYIQWRQGRFVPALFNGEPFPDSLPLLAMHAIATSWGMTLEGLLSSIRGEGDIDEIKLEQVGSYYGQDVSAFGFRIVRP